ncbi:glycosyltransferase [Dyella ginsengisoli]|uniref:Glycosyltransferase n=1 Tax=Dyella ginsengisoli TaxID=363848 RepID=A0ABW8JSL0_9GAMM
MVSYYMPCRGHGGGLRLLDLYSIIRKSFPGARLDLVAAKSAPDDAPEAEVLALFDQIRLLDPSDFSVEGFASVGILSIDYDVVDLQYLQSGKFIRAFRQAGAKKIIFSPMESMVRALGTIFRGFALRRAQIGQAWLNITFAAKELRYLFSADAVLCVSKGDAKVLRWFRWWGGVSEIETGVSPFEFRESLKEASHRRDLDEVRRIVFIAFFGSATNRDALNWYLREVHPLVLKSVPGYRFQVVGRGLSAEEVQAESVDLIGEVERIEPCLSGAWVGIAPALSGAGLRGKINQYAVAGIPCVAATLAAKGLAYRDGLSICLAGDAATFAKHCIRLLLYPLENKDMGLAARKVCLANYVWEAKTGQISRLYGGARDADSRKN